ncbi:MAG: DNA polymerase III subunit delta [Dehalococcoidia bacterium]
MIVVLEGQDEFRISERISEFKLTVTPVEMREFNTTVLDGNLITIGELLAAVSTVPFMADKRLVIVEGLLNKLGSPRKRGASGDNLIEWSDFPDLFSGMPETATLLIVEKTPLPSSKVVLQILKQSKVEKFPSLRYRELIDWINARCSILAVEMESQAIALLADSVGNELRLIDSELKKLETYSRGNLITTSDVRLMVPYVRQQNVFRVVDAVIEGRTRDALSASSTLISLGESPSAIVRMIERQIRFLFNTKYLISRKVPTSDIGKQINLSGYPLRKTLEMEKKISQTRILDMHDKLLESNLRVREGRLTEQESFDLLIAELR